MKRYFSLAEIMIVVVIIGLLIGIIVPKVTGQLGDATIQTCKANIKQISSEIDSYYLKHKKFPESLQTLVDNKILKKKHLLDPWGSEYQYEIDKETHAGYDILSAGEDRSFNSDDDISLEEDL